MAGAFGFVAHLDGTGVLAQSAGLDRIALGAGVEAAEIAGTGIEAETDRPRLGEDFGSLGVGVLLAEIENELTILGGEEVELVLTFHNGLNMAWCDTQVVLR